MLRVILLLLLVCVSFTIIGQPRNSVLIRVIESVSLKVIEKITVRKLGYGSYLHSVVTMALSCIISEIKQHIGRKTRFFTPLHSTAPLWDPRQNIAEYCRNV